MCWIYATSLLVLLRLAVAVSHLSLQLLSRQHQVSGFLFHDIILVSLFPILIIFYFFTVAILQSLFFVAPKVIISWTSPGQMFVPLMYPWIMFSSHFPRIVFRILTSMITCSWHRDCSWSKASVSVFRSQHNREPVKNYSADFLGTMIFR